MNLPSKLALLLENEDLEVVSYSVEITDNGFGISLVYVNSATNNFERPVRFAFMDEVVSYKEISDLIVEKISAQKRLQKLNADS